MEKRLVKFLDGSKKEFETLVGAYLRSANLQGADLAGADLVGANLRSANLRSANLRSADLEGANLAGADLVGANLRSANLRGANLRSANLRSADLAGANLRSVNLQGAYLAGADLQSANLRGAYLQSANLTDAKLPHFQICPVEGAFVAWKKTRAGVIKLEIPADALRTSSLIARKCRASKALVVSGDAGPSLHKAEFVYEVGKMVESDKFDPDIRVECTSGIHFFMTRREAEEYS